MACPHFGAACWKGIPRLHDALEGRGIIADQTWQLDVPGGKSVRREFTVRVPGKMGAGRHVFTVSGKIGEVPDESVSFLALNMD